MKIFTSIDSLPTFNNPIITIGTFDGVHLGHQKILKRLKDLATESNGETILLTFHPHPRKVIGSASQLFMLNTIAEKTALLAENGLDNLVMIPFSKEFSELSPTDYIKHILVEKFHPKTIVIGYDHKFGKDRQGDFHLLESVKEKYHFDLVEITQEMLEDISISSTKIRNALNEGKIKEANELLGYRYPLTGIVVKGLQNGRKLGYPTANISIADSEKLIPKNGIYAAFVYYEGKKYNGLLNIGFNPTFNAQKQTIEVNIVDFDKEIYGEELTVELVRYIRPEKKFDSLLDLIAAIDKDKEAILAILQA